MQAGKRRLVVSRRRMDAPFEPHRSAARRGERATDGRTLAEAPVVVLANAHDAVRLAPVSQPLARVRGQVTYVAADAIAAPRAIVSGSGYVLPAVDGIVMTGSTYDHDNDEP